MPGAIRNQVDAITKMLGTGMHLDRAWAKTQGDPSVLVAVTDSGIEWNEGELTNQVFLNRGELPPPMGGPSGCPGADGTTYDVNGDGKFNVAGLHDDDRPSAGAGGDGLRSARHRQERQRRHRPRGPDPLVLRRQG